MESPDPEPKCKNLVRIPRSNPMKSIDKSLRLKDIPTFLEEDGGELKKRERKEKRNILLKLLRRHSKNLLTKFLFILFLLFETSCLFIHCLYRLSLSFSNTFFCYKDPTVSLEIV